MLSMIISPPGINSANLFSGINEGGRHIVHAERDGQPFSRHDGRV